MHIRVKETKIIGISQKKTYKCPISIFQNKTLNVTNDQNYSEDNKKQNKTNYSEVPLQSS
jgi:hypothetical protein